MGEAQKSRAGNGGGIVQADAEGGKSWEDVDAGFDAQMAESGERAGGFADSRILQRRERLGGPFSASSSAGK